MTGTIANTKMYGGGRVQVPVAIRNALGLSDGDRVDWFLNGENASLKKAEQVSS